MKLHLSIIKFRDSAKENIKPGISPFNSTGDSPVFREF
jgi:hypothetical protein